MVVVHSTQVVLPLLWILANFEQNYKTKKFKTGRNY